MSYGMGSPTGKAPKGYKQGQMSNYTPEMMKLFKQMFSHVGPDSYTGRLAAGDESLFGEMEAPALRQFGELQGGMASKFSGMGMGARNSSGFQNTMNAATSNFAQDLQSKRQGLQRQAIMDLMGMSSDLLGQKPYENYMVEKAKPWWQEAATGFASGAGQGLGKAALGGF